MGRGIKSCRNLIHAGSNDPAILDDHRSKRTAFTVGNILNRQLDCFLDEFASVHPAPCAAHISNSPRMLR
jgi:hypothetical protein